jgi:type I restriction enzyme M protein
MTATTDIVQKLWNLCNVLRDDGVTYLQYVTELTYLLFLKMMQENPKQELESIPEGYRWSDLVSHENDSIRDFYIQQLLHLGKASKSKHVRQVFANAQTAVKTPTNLRKIIVNIDELDWYSAKAEGLGDLCGFDFVESAVWDEEGWWFAES